MSKTKNDPSRFIRRADISPGAPAKLSGAHLKKNAERANRIVKKIIPMKREFIEL